MAPSPRARDEGLIVRGAEGDRVLFWHLDHERGGLHDEAMLPSQRRFQVSPDARVLAYMLPSSAELHVLRRDGAELTLDGSRFHDMRFSPDGSTLLVTRYGDANQVDRVDLRRMEARRWAELARPRWIEPCADGLVVAQEHMRTLGGRKRIAGNSIVLVPWDGPVTTLVESKQRITRLSAAAAGTRVVYRIGEGFFSLARPGERPVALPPEVPDVAGSENFEMSPDGRAVAFATDRGVVLQDGEAGLEVLAEQQGVHTIWFSRDGAELAWASPEAAVWRRGGEERKLVPTLDEGKIAAMRFLRGGAGLLVSRGKEVVRWSPERDEAEVLARVDDGRELLGADAFDGGLVMWVGTPWAYRGGRGT